MFRTHEGRVAVVTGAGSGLGQAFALGLAQRGAEVLAVDLAEPSETLTLIEEAGGRARAVIGDVSQPETASAVARETATEFGGCDILINNAGIYPTVPFADVDFALWRKVLSVNLDSMYLLSHALVPGMREKGWGRIVNLTSNTVGLNVTNCVPYIASKAGVIGFTRGLANDLGPHGITVNAIAPSLVRTPGTMSRPAGPGGIDTEDEYALIASMQAVNRPELPVDLVGTVAFLTTDDAAFVTAQTVYVDGGLVRG